ncbi:MAG: PqqD family peptide modification chaperone, partial [bacterium]
DARVVVDELHLNGMAGNIWRLCDGTRTVEKIAREIRSSCTGSPPPYETVLGDVVRFLESAHTKHWITWPEARSTDVLLVVPPAPSGYSTEAVKTPEYSAPPLGLCYIAAVLREGGFRPAILDLHQAGGHPEDVISACRRYNPAIVGITACTPSFPNAERVARFVKAWNKDCVTVIGGPHAVGAPEECVETGVFDFVCLGEGEHAMLDLTTALLKTGGAPKTIPGFAFKSSVATLKRSARRPRLARLDSLPLPARDLIDLDNYAKKGALISSRGCPIGCVFCACTSIVGRTYRVHSVGRVLDEMEQLVGQNKTRHFDFHDDTFNLYPQRVFEFCRAMADRRMDVEWGCFCRAAQMTPPMAKAMVKAGCRVIQFGVESGNAAVLRSLNKKTTTDQIEQAVRAAAKAGVEQIVCGFIIGHASDTPDSIRDTIAFGLRLRDLGATRLTLSLLTPYPGTQVYNRRQELGIRLLTKDWEQYTFSRVVMETANLRTEELRRLYCEGVLCFMGATRW